MSLKVLSFSYTGIETYIIEVEIDISGGLPNLNIIGLGDAAISESRERVRTAMKNSGYPLEPRKIIVNLSPAAIRKEGSHFDLAIAAGIAAGMGFIKDRKNIFEDYLILGELALDGAVKGVKGVICGSILAKEIGMKGVIVPFENFREAAAIPGIHVLGVRTLKELLLHISLGEELPLDNGRDMEEGSDIIGKRKNAEGVERNSKKDWRVKNMMKGQEHETLDLSDVKGQEAAKRALEISAAGGHNLLMIGSPGSGKSMLAKRINTILPRMELDEIIECSRIYSIMGELSEENPLVVKRPFRSPHHTGTITSIIGGGRNVRPGEISMAHNGVLFLDELSEFSKEVIESLRQPLEDRKVSVSRTGYRVDFPTKFILIAASNPCNCGNLFEPEEECICSAREVERYKRKISGPILDRMDLYVEIKKLKDEELIGRRESESSQSVRERVERARDIQRKRLGNLKMNCDLNQKEIGKYCELSEENKQYMSKVIKSFKLTARSFDKILKVARTIADLEARENIEKNHILEALSFRKS